MDLSGYHTFLENLATQSANLGERLLVIPANNLIADIDQRITIEGKDSNGRNIGKYSKKKWWATAKSFDNKDNFKPQERKDGEGRRTSITLEEGYFELRKLQGYRVDKKVMERTGAGIKNIKQEVQTVDGHTTVVIGFTDENEAVKFRSEEKRGRRPILLPSKMELQRYRDAQLLEIKTFYKEMIAKQ